jgi:hypothetical protein
VIGGSIPGMAGWRVRDQPSSLPIYQCNQGNALEIREDISILFERDQFISQAPHRQEQLGVGRVDLNLCP